MASFMQALVEYLGSVPAITSKVPADKIVPKKIRQGSTAPYIIVSRVTAEHSQDLAGACDFGMPTYSIKCYGNTYEEAEEIFELVRENLDGYQQKLMGTTNPFWVNSTKLEDDYDDDDEVLPNDQSQAYFEIREAIYKFGFPQANSVV